MFIVHNNQWAISMPVYRLTASGPSPNKAFACPGSRANGNDVLAIYSKSGRPWTVPAGIPTVIETVSYHAMDHNTSDSPAVYRDAPWRRSRAP